jgi:cytochrome c553
VLPHVRRGAQLAAFLELLSGEPGTVWDVDSVRAALAWTPRDSVIDYPQVVVGILAMLTCIAAVALVVHGKSAAAIYSPDDAIYPGGVKRDPDAIVRFMETEVMPWARIALAPIKGGPAAISCVTCHGQDGAERQWQMPAVAALPQPDLILSGWELYGGGMDAQMRNAIYGYVAESDNQAKATYMREVVMPGMAALLHRPPYDFTRTYEYNRTRVAFGCYHCHRVN